jgi:hypothetical protein
VAGTPADSTAQEEPAPDTVGVQSEVPASTVSQSSDSLAQ